MDFRKQKTTRVYLHPFESDRLIMLMRDFKIADLSLSLKAHYGLKGAAMAILGDGGKELPWRESVFDALRDGYPFYTLRVTDTNGAAVSFSVFSSTKNTPVTYFRVTVENRTEKRIAGTLAFLPCTSANDRYLTGLWDTGYGSYAPNKKCWTMLDSAYEAHGALLADGYAGLRLSDMTDVCYEGEKPHFFDYSHFFRVSYRLAPGEKRMIDGVFGLCGALPEKVDYDAAFAAAKAYWDGIFSQISVYPATDDAVLRDIYRSQITNCLQMIQRYDDGTVFPRQGCVGRYIWAWEAAHFLIALDRAGLAAFTRAPLETLLVKWMILDEANESCGKIDNPVVHWANTNGSVIWCASEHLIMTRDRALYDRWLPYLKKAVGYIERMRAGTKAPDAPGLFPSAVASDWSEVGQHYTYTDSVNVMGYRSLLRAVRAFGGDDAWIEKAYTDYDGVLKRVIASLEEGHDESEDYMPTHILGKDFREVRTHCYTTDGVIYLPMCGNLDPNGKLFGFVERFYEKHGLFDHGLAARMTNLDFGEPGVYGDCYYTGVAEIAWMYAYLQKGERSKAAAMLDAVLYYNLTSEYVAAERYTPLDEWYAPWQPNASASGRIVSGLLDFYGEKER